MTGKTNSKQTAEEKAEVRKTAREAKRASIMFYEKYLLTMEEAVVYFHIGGKKMTELVRDNSKAKWVLMNGKRMMINKDRFAMWLDQQSEI